MAMSSSATPGSHSTRGGSSHFFLPGKCVKPIENAPPEHSAKGVVGVVGFGTGFHAVSMTTERSHANRPLRTNLLGQCLCTCPYPPRAALRLLRLGPLVGVVITSPSSSSSMQQCPS